MSLVDIINKIASYEGWINMFDAADAPLIDRYIAIGQRIAPTLDRIDPKLVSIYKQLEPFIAKVQKNATNPAVIKVWNDIIVELPKLQAVLPQIVSIYNQLEPLITKLQAANNPDVIKAWNDIATEFPKLQAVLPQIQAVLPDVTRVLKTVADNS